jgi:hypothetical protein
MALTIASTLRTRDISTSPIAYGVNGKMKAKRAFLNFRHGLSHQRKSKFEIAEGEISFAIGVLSVGSPIISYCE